MSVDEVIKPEALADSNLYLVELDDGKQVRYALCERFLTVEPDHGVMDVPWSELAALFKGRTLRAVPMPGRMRGGRSRLAEPGVSTDIGVSTNVEVNLIKIGKTG